MRTTLGLFAAACLALPASAQQVVATSPLNVRSGQSTSSTIRGHLDQGDTATLVSPSPRLGYYHLKTQDGVTGWAWAARLTLVEAGGANPPAQPAPAQPSSGSSANSSSTIDASWDKTPTNAVSIHWADGNHASCAAGGVGGDQATNVWKNRTDSASTYHAVTWHALATLPFPRNSTKSRGGNSGWSDSDLAAIAKYEGMPVSVEAYLSGVKEEIPNRDPKTHQLKKGESTNCGQNTSPRVDWHMYLTEKPHDSHKLAIVVETTPRVRPAHPGWTIDRLQKISSDGTPVRISGWLMMDPEHYDQMWKYHNAGDTTGTKARITLWEIHPITRIDIKKNGTWIPLDSLQGSP